MKPMRFQLLNTLKFSELRFLDSCDTALDCCEQGWEARPSLPQHAAVSTQQHSNLNLRRVTYKHPSGCTRVHDAVQDLFPILSEIKKTHETCGTTGRKI